MVSAGVVLPAGYDQALRAGRAAEVTFVVDQTRPAPAPVRTAVSAVVARQAAEVKAARFAAEQAGVPFDTALARARALADGQEQVRVEATTIGGREDALPTGFNYTAPANLVLFVFITSLAGAAGLIEARRLGVIRRMLATPTTTATILFGEALSRFAVALLQGDDHLRGRLAGLRGRLGRPPGRPPPGDHLRPGRHRRRHAARLDPAQRRAGHLDRPAGRHRPRHARRLHVAPGHRPRAHARRRPPVPPGLGHGRLHRPDRQGRGPSPASPSSWPSWPPSPSPSWPWPPGASARPWPASPGGRPGWWRRGRTRGPWRPPPKGRWRRGSGSGRPSRRPGPPRSPRPPPRGRARGRGGQGG